MACPDWLRKDMRKTSVTNTGSKTTSNIRDMGSLFHGPKAQGYADGGEVEALKQEGLKASAGDTVGFWERIKAGNIDDPSSEAYRRWGAGRGEEARLQAREDARDAAMSNIMRTAKPADDRNEMDKASDAAQSAPKAVAAPKAKPAVKVKPPEVARPDRYENESPAETRRLERQSKEAGEREEASKPFIGRPTRKTPAGGVTPRPMMNWSTPADRARWDEKYKDKYNTDGTPK